MPGQILGERYEVQQQLGKKQGRWTLLARDLKTEILVILKLLFIDEDTTLDELRLFQREIEALQTLAHPATPKYLEYFEIDLPKDGKALTLVQSYIEGVSLQQMLQQNQVLDETQALWVAQSILELLCYLHDRQPPIIHRDIQPSNILLSTVSRRGSYQQHSHQAHTNRHKVHLVDFGSIKSLNTHDYTSFTMVGTVGYIPPEQMGQRAIKASDLYSLGVTLVTGMTGIEPADLPRRGLQIEVDKALSCIPNIHPDFVQWLQSMVAPSLDRRYKTADEALAALHPVAALVSGNKAGDAVEESWLKG
jgi:serine/threonine protein kinase